MPWRKLRCASCKRELLMESVELQNLQQKQQQISCPTMHCPGQMLTFGHIITRRKTAETKQSYNYLVNRQLLKRGNTVISYNESDDEDDDEVEEALTKKSKKHNKKKEEEEEEFVLAPDFNPAMRLRGDGVFCPRGLSNSGPGTIIKSSGRHKITNKIIGERSMKPKAMVSWL